MGVERAVIDNAVGIRTAEGLLDGDVRELVQRLARTLQGAHVRMARERERLRSAYRKGEVDFPAATANVRRTRWQVDPPPEKLLERRVELLCGSTRAALVRGLNAGARSCIADLWALTPGGAFSVLRGLRHIARAAQLDLAYVDPQGGRERVNPSTITRLIVGPRPLSVLMARAGEEPVPAGVVDLAHHVVHSGKVLAERQGGVYLLLRDVQGHLEARAWARAIAEAEAYTGLPRGTVRATVMVDSVAAALEAEEILYELLHWSAGLAMDPQAYAADHIALFTTPDGPVFPDRGQVAMNAPFLRALSLHLIGLCHRRGCHAMGAPSFVLRGAEGQPAHSALLEMLADKEREAVDGHDGAIVCDPATVTAAMMEYNKAMPKAHQIGYQRPAATSAADLFNWPVGPISVEGLQGLVGSALRWIAPPIGGEHVVEHGGRRHDRSSVRLAMCLLWHWARCSNAVITATGLPIDGELIRYLARKEAAKVFTEGPHNYLITPERATAHLLERVLGEDPPVVV